MAEEEQQDELSEAVVKWLVEVHDWTEARLRERGCLPPEKEEETAYDRTNTKALV